MSFYSQHGEDRWIAENLPLPNPPYPGLMVEVGVGRWREFSNSLHFEERPNFEIVLVEPNPALHPEIRAHRRGKLFPCAAGAYDGVCSFVLENEPTLSGILRHGSQRVELPIRTLTGILDEALEEKKGQRDEGTKGQSENAVAHPLSLSPSVPLSLSSSSLPRTIDVLSIDTEGTELEVWRGLDLSRYRPRVVVIEFSTLGLPEDPMSIIRRLLADRYALVHVCGGNLIFKDRISC